MRVRKIPSSSLIPMYRPGRLSSAIVDGAPAFKRAPPVRKIRQTRILDPLHQAPQTKPVELATARTQSNDVVHWDTTRSHPDSGTWWFGLYKQTTGLQKATPAMSRALGAGKFSVKTYSLEPVSFQVRQCAEIISRICTTNGSNDITSFLLAMCEAARGLFDLGASVTDVFCQFFGRGFAVWCRIYRDTDNKMLRKPYIELLVPISTATRGYTIQQGSPRLPLRLRLTLSGEIGSRLIQSHLWNRQSIKDEEINMNKISPILAVTNVLQKVVAMSVKDQKFLTERDLLNKVKDDVLRYLPSSTLRSGLDFARLNLEWDVVEAEHGKQRVVDNINLYPDGSAMPPSAWSKPGGNRVLSSRHPLSLQTNIEIETPGNGDVELQLLGSTSSFELSSRASNRIGLPEAFVVVEWQRPADYSLLMDEVLKRFDDLCCTSSARGMQMLAMIGRSLALQYPRLSARIQLYPKGGGALPPPARILINFDREYDIPVTRDSLLLHFPNVKSSTTVAKLAGTTINIKNWQMTIAAQCTHSPPGQEQTLATATQSESFAQAYSNLTDKASTVIDHLLRELKFDTYEDVAQMAAEALLRILRFPEPQLEICTVRVRPFPEAGQNRSTITSTATWSSRAKNTSHAPEDEQASTQAYSPRESRQAVAASENADMKPEDAASRESSDHAGLGCYEAPDAHSGQYEATKSLNSLDKGPDRPSNVLEFRSEVLRDRTGFDTWRISTKAKAKPWHELQVLARERQALLERCAASTKGQSISAAAAALQESARLTHQVDVTASASVGRPWLLYAPQDFKFGENPLQLDYLLNGKFQIHLPNIANLPLHVAGIDGLDQPAIWATISLIGKPQDPQSLQPLSLASQLELLHSVVVKTALVLAANQKFDHLRMAAASFADALYVQRQAFVSIIEVETVRVNARYGRIKAGNQRKTPNRDRAIVYAGGSALEGRLDDTTQHPGHSNNAAPARAKAVEDSSVSSDHTAEPASKVLEEYTENTVNTVAIPGSIPFEGTNTSLDTNSLSSTVTERETYEPSNVEYPVLKQHREVATIDLDADMDAWSTAAFEEEDVEFEGDEHASPEMQLPEGSLNRSHRVMETDTEPRPGSYSEGGVFIALGSNMGDRVRNIEMACNLMNADPDIKLVQTSSLYETEPMYVENQDSFLNGACEIATSLEPLQLLDRLQAIENKLGRIRTIDKGPRTIDLDILIYKDIVLQHERLKIPHPLIAERPFVLQPLNQIYDDMIPGIHAKPSSLHNRLGPMSLSTRTYLAPNLALLAPRQPGRSTLIMSILNTTPDSFSDGGVYQPTDLDHLKQVVQAQIERGATIIDIGGQSSRPGAPDVSADEEIARILPAIEAVKDSPGANNVAISIDTYRAAVAQAAIHAGAHIVNDISAGTLDKDMLPTIAQLGCTYVMMHMRGTPATMQSDENCSYPYGMMNGIMFELDYRVQLAIRAGIRPWRIIIDPGVGFSKTAGQNVELLGTLWKLRARSARRGKVRRLCRYPLLVGSSRKSFVGTITGVEEPAKRQWGTAATVAVAISHGADIVRVHDVQEMAEVAKMADAMR